MDRREALRKLGVAGAIAVGGSMVLSSNSVAYATSVVTCLTGIPGPSDDLTVGNGFLTYSATANNREITLTISVNAMCDCGGPTQATTSYLWDNAPTVHAPASQRNRNSVVRSGAVTSNVAVLTRSKPAGTPGNDDKFVSGDRYEDRNQSHLGVRWTCHRPRRGEVFDRGDLQRSRHWRRHVVRHRLTADPPTTRGDRMPSLAGALALALRQGFIPGGIVDRREALKRLGVRRARSSWAVPRSCRRTRWRTRRRVPASRLIPDPVDFRVAQPTNRGRVQIRYQPGTVPGSSISYQWSDAQILPGTPNPVGGVRIRNGARSRQATLERRTVNRQEAAARLGGRWPVALCCSPSRGAAPARPNGHGLLLGVDRYLHERNVRRS